jgi:hypothetical protein
MSLISPPFDDLIGFKKVVVLGPQRSGTRIGTLMIANVLNIPYIQEDAFGVHCFERATTLITESEKICLHAPALTYKAHCFEREIAIVFMMRSVEDIIASQERIDWKCEKDEKSLYEDPILNPFCNLDDPICKIKGDVYFDFQADLIDSHFELSYYSLRYNPLWVQEKHRKNFSFDQTSN